MDCVLSSHTPGFTKSSWESCHQKIVRTDRLAERLGVRILGLGGTASVVGDAGVTVAENLGIPVAAGNSYTVAAALEATKVAAEVIGVELRHGVMAVVGAAGSVGRVCARLLAREAGDMIPAGRTHSKLEGVALRCVLWARLMLRSQRRWKRYERTMPLSP